MGKNFALGVLPIAVVLASGSAAAQSYTVAPGQTTTVSGQIVDNGVATPVIVTGGGTLIFTNTLNSYSGGTNVSGNSTLQLDSDAEMGNVAAGIALGDATTPGILNFAGTAAITSARTIGLNAGGGVFIVNSLGTSLSGQISGAGGVTVTGGGILTLLGANSYTGNTLVTGGTTLALDSDSNLGGYTYTTVTSNITGTTTTSALTTANTLTLDGAILQFNGAFAISHPITLTVNGGTFNTNGNNDTISTVIGGPGGLTKTGGGFLVLDGVNSYTGGTTVAGGVLMVGDVSSPTATIVGPVSVSSGATFAGTGTVLGTLTNPSGTVSSGAGGLAGLTATNYVQGATGSLVVPVTSSGAATFRVTNSASLAGTMSLAYGGGYFKPGTYTLITAPVMTGSFSAITGSIPSVGLSQNIVVTPNQINVVLTQRTTLPDHPTLYPSMITVAVDEAQQATQTLLTRLQDARALGLVDGLNSALSTNHRVRGLSPYGAWVQPTGNMSTLSGSGAAPHMSGSGGGFLAGIDAAVAEGMAMGFAVGYNRSGFDETGGASATLSVPRFAIYGDWWKGPFAIDAVVSAAAPTIDATRPIIVSPQTAKSTHDGKEFSAALQASVAFLVDDWSLSPAAGVKYLSLSQNHFTETGTDLYNFGVGASHANSMRPFIDATVLRRFEVEGRIFAVPQLTVGYEDEILKTTRSISAQTQGDAATWVFQGAKPSKGAADVKADLNIETDKQTSYYLEYGRIQGSNSSADSFAAGFRYRL